MTLIGTKPYMSPEAIHNVRHYKIIPYSFDVWSLGVTIVEIVTQKHLFDLETFSGDSSGYQLLNHIVNLKEDPVIPEEIQNVQLRDLISRCLKLDPEERATVKELLNHPFFTEIIVSDGVERQDLVSDTLHEIEINLEENEEEDLDMISDYVSEFIPEEEVRGTSSGNEEVSNN